MIYINGEPFGDKKFPNNEINYKKPKLSEIENTIYFYFESNEDFFNLILLRDYIFKQNTSDVILNIPYFPYSRMDREIGEQIFSLKYVTNLLNRAYFQEINFFDAHSPVLLDNLRIGTSHPLIDVLEKQKIPHYDFILFPDKGASLKYSEQFANSNIDSGVIVGNKTRDKVTGKITSYNIETGGWDLEGSTILIVDDICSYGGTFLMASEALQKYKPKDILLWVSHCENSIFEGKILTSNLISNVITTNSIIRTKTHSKLLELPIFGKDSFYA